jgi:hypothetical protein
MMFPGWGMGGWMMISYISTPRSAQHLLPETL